MPFKPSFDAHFIVNEIIAQRRLEDVFGQLSGFVPLDGWSLSYQAIMHLGNYLQSVDKPVVLEFGSGSGTIWLAHVVGALEGRLISIEHDELFYRKIAKALEHEGLSEVVDYRLCPLSAIACPSSEILDGAIWYSELIGESIDADAIIIDGPPGILRDNSRLPAGVIALNWCNSECLVVVDDVERPDERRLSALVESEAIALGYSATRETTSNTDFIYLSKQGSVECLFQ